MFEFINNKITKRVKRFSRRLCLFFLNKDIIYLPDKVYLKLKFYLLMNRRLNLKRPTTFNEKLQWLKLYDRNPLYTQMVDKVEVKKYVAEKIGDEYIIPTLGVWESPDEIDFDSLPNQFVIKCNHNSGQGIYVCTDKGIMDVEEVRDRLRQALKNNYYKQCREWPYKNVHRKIIAEQYLEDSSSKDGDLMDYKFMCFNGNVKCSFVCTNRKRDLNITFFDLEWNQMPFERHYPRSETTIPKPSKYDDMIRLAEILSKDIPFVRVDFYEVNGHIYFGELTFFPGAGFEEFTPEHWDTTLGSWIEIKN